jgi:predicted Zn-dependent peptidase
VPRGPFDAGLLRRQPAATLLACATRPLGDLRATDGALEVFTALLGEGTRSRLAQALREEGGYTYTAYAGVVRRRAARAFVACAPLAAARADEGLEAFRVTLDGLRRRIPGDAELRRVKALRLARLDDAQEGVANETEAWTEALVLGQQEPRRAREEAEIAAVTAEELGRIARIALRPEGLRWILSGDPAIAAKAVRKNRLGRLLGLPLGR